MNLVNIPVTIDELVALWKLRHGNTDAATQAIPRPAVRVIAQETATTSASPSGVMATRKFQYKIFGEQRRAKSSIVAFLDILTTLSSLEPSLPARLAQVAPANTRNHIAHSRVEVYPGRPDLGRKSREFSPGWYAGTNLADREKRRILRLACGILCLRFGMDIVF